MTVTGPDIGLPPKLQALQPHVRTIVKAIQIMCRKHGIALSDDILILMKNYLINNHRHFHQEKTIYNQQHHLPTDSVWDDPAFASLMMTLKYFQLYLNKKSETPFDVFAAFICASLLADKMSYDQVEPGIGDVHEIFRMLHRNIIKAMSGIFKEISLVDDDWWRQEIENHFDFLELISEYGAMSADAELALISIEENLPNHLQDEFINLNKKLFILAKFVESPSDNGICTKDDEFSFDSCLEPDEHYDPRDYEAPVDYSSTTDSDNVTNDRSHNADSDCGSYAGSVGTQLPGFFIFNLSKHESHFLQTLDFQFELSFTLLEAYEILYEAEQFINQPEKYSDRFFSCLNAFGEGNSLGSQPGLGSPVVPPCSPTLLARFEETLKQNNTIPLRSVSTQEILKPSLRRPSY